MVLRRDLEPLDGEVPVSAQRRELLRGLGRVLPDVRVALLRGLDQPALVRHPADLAVARVVPEVLLLRQPPAANSTLLTRQ